MALAVVDANLLIYAFNPRDKDHSAAKAWMEEVLSGEDVLAIPMLSITALLRISTHPSLDNVPQRMEEVLSFIDQLTAMPNVQVLHTGTGHWEELKRVINESGVNGPTVTDAQFAALTLQYGATLYSADKHFRRFPRLRWVNPLQPKERVR